MEGPTSLHLLTCVPSPRWWRTRQAPSSHPLWLRCSSAGPRQRALQGRVELCLDNLVTSIYRGVRAGWSLLTSRPGKAHRPHKVRELRNWSREVSQRQVWVHNVGVASSQQRVDEHRVHRVCELFRLLIVEVAD